MPLYLLPLSLCSSLVMLVNLVELVELVEIAKLVARIWDPKSKV